jgi:mannose-1-phosphate guanylyltransferase
MRYVTRKNTAGFHWRRRGRGLEGTVLTEPRPKNTSAAILYAAIYLVRLYEDSVMLVLPADHHIRDNAVFASTIRKAIAEAGRGRLVTIGIRPSYHETLWLYKGIRGFLREILEWRASWKRPDLATAEGYVKSGRYFWNSACSYGRHRDSSGLREYLPEYGQGLRISSRLFSRQN